LAARRTNYPNRTKTLRTLSLDPIRADALILLESNRSVLHLEFQTRPDPDLPFRMLDYRARVYRRYRNKTMRQVVIYLKQTGSDLVQQTSFVLERTRHDFDVVRLWEQPKDLFLQYPGLAPFAVLSQTDDPEATLRQAAQVVNQIVDPSTQANLTAASAILAGLKLQDEVIYRVLRKDIMKESTVYRSILEEGLAEGLAEGKAQGLLEGKAQGLAEGEAQAKREIALNLLSRGVAIDIIVASTGLSTEEVQQLQLQVSESSQG
jgi:predicted transposase/invertase (TIGR01784 family)